MRLPSRHADGAGADVDDDPPLASAREKATPVRSDEEGVDDAATEDPSPPATARVERAEGIARARGYQAESDERQSACERAHLRSSERACATLFVVGRLL